ncbi:staphylococcal nuclease [Panus rudis PR-1116 ss-1]|nr:staphylococcal nuclease [Panus rudis PR-1116 ss-1]
MNAMYIKHFKRIPTGEYVTPEMISGRHWIKGKVTSVGDSDGFRLYHTPGFGWRWPFKFRSVPSTNKELQNQTLSIRIAGIDAPEGAHWGRPSQLWAQESLDWLKSQVEGKWVCCQILRKDQYSRIVSPVIQNYRFIPRFISKGRPLSLEMVRAGWAVTYEQANAEYGGYPKEEYTRLEAEAQAAKRGMWKNGPLIETPAEYKRKYASSVETAEAALSEATVVPSSKTTQKKVSQGTKAEGGWVSWLFGRKR